MPRHPALTASTISFGPHASILMRATGITKEPNFFTALRHRSSGSMRTTASTPRSRQAATYSLAFPLKPSGSPWTWQSIRIGSPFAKPGKTGPSRLRSSQAPRQTGMHSPTLDSQCQERSGASPEKRRLLRTVTPLFDAAALAGRGAAPDDSAPVPVEPCLLLKRLLLLPRSRLGGDADRQDDPHRAR